MMKIRIELGEHVLVVEATDAAGLLRQTRLAAAGRAPLLMRAVIAGMNDLAFASEVVRRSNTAHRRADPQPANADRFLEWAVAMGYARALDEA